MKVSHGFFIISQILLDPILLLDLKDPVHTEDPDFTAFVAVTLHSNKWLSLILHLPHRLRSHLPSGLLITGFQIDDFQTLFLLDRHPNRSNLFVERQILFRETILEGGHELHNSPIHEDMMFLDGSLQDNAIKRSAP